MREELIAYVKVYVCTLHHARSICVFAIFFWLCTMHCIHAQMFVH